MAKFSVIMPCYNSEQYLHSAIESVVKQTYSDWELIAVNDGSTDKTLEILNAYCLNDKRIKVFSKENGGYATAVNFGLNYVSGDFFLLLGSDDYLSKTLFEELDSYIDETHFPDCVAFRTRMIFDYCKNLLDPYTAFDTFCFEENTTLKKYSDKYPKHGMIFQSRDTSRCYKTSLLGELRYFGKYGISADGIFSLLFCHKATSFMNIPCDGYFWNVREGSVSSKMSFDKERDSLNNWILFFEHIQKLDENEVTNMEKEYVGAMARSAINLSKSFCSWRKHRSVSKKGARFAIAMGKKYSLDNILKYTSLRIVSISPFVFCIMHAPTRKLVNMFKKFVGKK